MKNIKVIEGQVNLFDLPIQGIIKPKEEKILIIEKPLIKEDNFKEIINLYKESCSRIVKRISGALLVEVEDRTMYFNSQGINQFNLSRDVGLMPGDEIILVNEDKEINDLQLDKLQKIDPNQYIKRKGDANIIIFIDEKTTVITNRGWVIDYEQKPKYKEDEIVILKNSEKIIDEELKIGDSVEFKYKGKQNTGEIKSIYNNGETVNVSWDNKRTAFYYKCVKKIGA